MNQDEGFIQAIRAEPDDDALRLIYADWLEEHGDAPAAARARFIRLQCERASLTGNLRRRRALVAEELRLLRDHWDAWLNPLREALGPGETGHWLRGGFTPDALGEFRRGFIESMRLWAVTYLNRAAELLRLTPLRELSLLGARLHPELLAESPSLQELTTLSFADYYENPLDAAGARALAGSAHLIRLTSLSLQRNNLGDEGVIALSAAPWLARLKTLILTDNGISAVGVEALVRSPHCPRPEVLRMGNNFPGALGVQMLARSPILSAVRELDLSECNLTDSEAAVLAASPHLACLEELGLQRNPITPEGRRPLRERFGVRVIV